MPNPIVVYRPARCGLAAEKLDAIKQLIREGKNYKEVAKILKSCPKTISRHARAMGLRERREAKIDILPRVTGQLVAKPPETLEWLQQCRNILGERLHVKTIRGETVYYLDGKMATACKIIETAKRL